MTPKFEPSAYQQAIFDWVVNGRGDAVVQAVAGCLAGDTMIGINRAGKSYQVRLDRLVHMMNGGVASNRVYNSAIPTKVRSLVEPEHYTIGLNEVAAAVYSGEKLTYTVETESGKSVRATADHQFLTDKGWVKLKDLVCGNVLLTDAGRSKKQSKSKRCYKRTFGLINHPYHHSDGRKGHVWNHRLAAEARLNEISVEDLKAKIRKGKIDDLQFLDPSIWVVHHIDENPNNNHPDNLQVMTVEEHHSHHAIDGGWRHVQSKVAPDPIKSITEYGIEPTYDLTMANSLLPNFLASGIVVHNSGKTTTLVQAAKLLNSSKATFVAFNKHVAKELQERLGSSMVCKTIHSVGMGTLRSSLSKISVDDNKYYDLAKPYAKEIAEGLYARYQTDLRQWARQRGSDTPEPKEPPKAGFITSQLKQLSHYCMVTLTPAADKAAVEEMIDTFTCLNDSLDLNDLHYALQSLLREGERVAANRGTISYDDMLWLPHQWNLTPARQEWVYVDESQDLSAAQLDLVLKMRGPGGRMLFVGDPKQCQPAGTLISLPRNQQKPIEELQVGDEVVSYDRNGAAFVGLRNQGRKVLAISSRPYRGQIITVKAASRTTECTPNHRWIARWTDRLPNKYVTYLMRQGDRFRVGWCQLFQTTGDLHLGVRARNEKADAAWILGVHTDRTKASIQESVIATMFGLPTIPFEPVRSANHLTKVAIDEFFTTLSELDLMQEQKAKDCLAWFGRDIFHPLYSKTERQRQGRTTIFETTASNLIPGLMSVPYFEGDRVVRWASIDVESAIKECTVYSLKIETHETYVADGLVTHNSIYGFAGACSDSIERIIKRTKAIVLPLSICYRCPSKHVALAKTIVTQIKAAPDAEEGIVENIPYNKVSEIVREGDLIVSRCTAPAVKLCIELIGKRIPARVRGRDIGRSLTAIVREVATHPDFDFKKFGKFLDEYRSTKIAKLEQKKNSQAQIESLCDRISGIIVCWEAFNSPTLEEFCNEIENLFSDSRSSVILSTVHRAKGLEEKRVFILRPDQLPLRYPNQQSWELEQEYNLRYVALTRAKEALYFVEDEVKAKKCVEEHSAEDEDDSMSMEEAIDRLFPIP